MNKEIKIFLIKAAPSLILLLLSFLQGVFTGFLNLFIFVFIYSLIFYYFLINEKFFNIIAIVISGVILDSVNDIYLGLSSFLFLSVYAISKFESKYIKVKDFLTTYMFFALNILITIIFIVLLSLFVDTNFATPIEFVVISLIIFPLVYNGTRIYKMVFSKSYEKY